MIVLVTGANGLVGSAICRESVLRGNHTVALVRPRADTSYIPVECFVSYGNFWKPEDARRVIDENRPDVIIHTAAVISTGTPNLEESWRVNVEGTRVLAQAAKAIPPERWLQVSSMSAHPENKSIYGATKLAADEALRQSGLPVTWFRPSLVYGPQPRGIFHKMLQLVKRLPVIPLIGFGKEPMRPVYVDDLAAAFFDALEEDETNGKVYQLAGPEDWRFRDVMAALARHLGKRPLLLPVPLPICRLLAAAGETVMKNPPLTTDNIEGISKAQHIDISSAKNDFGFNPRSFDEGMKRSLDQTNLAPPAVVPVEDEPSVGGEVATPPKKPAKKRRRR